MITTAAHQKRTQPLNICCNCAIVMQSHMFCTNAPFVRSQHPLFRGFCGIPTTRNVENNRIDVIIISLFVCYRNGCIFFLHFCVRRHNAMDIMIGHRVVGRRRCRCRCMAWEVCFMFHPCVRMCHSWVRVCHQDCHLYCVSTIIAVAACHNASEENWITHTICASILYAG